MFLSLFILLNLRILNIKNICRVKKYLQTIIINDIFYVLSIILLNTANN